MIPFRDIYPARVYKADDEVFVIFVVIFKSDET